MDLVSILATVILLATLGTLVAAVAAYIAYKLRERRKPRKNDPTLSASGEEQAVFIKPYNPDEDSTVYTSTISQEHQK